MRRLLIVAVLLALSASVEAQTCPSGSTVARADSLIAEANRSAGPRRTTIRALAGRIKTSCVAAPTPPPDTVVTPPPGPTPPPAPVVLPTPTTSSPGTPTSLGPTINTTTPTFSWSAVAGATGYVLAIRDLMHDVLVFPSTTGVGAPITGTSFTLPAGVIRSGVPYRWDVTAVNATSKSLASADRYFSVAAPTPVPTPLPVDTTPPEPAPPPTGIAMAILPRSVPVVPAGLSSSPCTVTVPAGGFQAALDAATGGGVLCLTGTHTGTFTVPARTDAGWVVIRSAGTIPAGRMTPTKAAPLAKIATPLSGSGTTLRFLPRSVRTLVLGVEITSVQSMTIGPTALIEVGGYETTVADLPTDIVFERVYAHGWPQQHVRRAFTMNGGAQTVKDSWCSEIHAAGFDSQCVISWGGTGPILVENNYLEAASENVMLGGADSQIRGIVTSDVTIRRNHIAKPIAWKGQNWNVKNLIETKSGSRVLIENNVLDGAWLEGQVGYAFVLKTTNQNGACGWCSSNDWTIRRNLIRNVGGGFSIAGWADGRVTDSTNRRFTIEENWLEPINIAPFDGEGRAIVFSAGNSDIIFRKNVFDGDAVQTVAAIVIDGSGNAVRNLSVTGNAFTRGQYGMFLGGAGEGLVAWTNGVLGTKVWANALVTALSAPPYPVGTTWHATIAQAIAASGAVTRATIDAAVAGVVVIP